MTQQPFAALDEREPLGPDRPVVLFVGSVLSFIPWLGLVYAAILGSPPGARTSLPCEDATLGCWDFASPRHVIETWLWPAGVCVVAAVAIAVMVAWTRRARDLPRASLVWPASIVAVAASALGVYAWYLS